MIEIHWFLWMLVCIGCLIAGGSIGLLIMGIVCHTNKKDVEYWQEKYHEMENEKIRLQEQEDALRKELTRVTNLYNQLINKEV